MPPSSATILVSGCSSFHSAQVDRTTVACDSTTPASWRGPETASPVKVSNTDDVIRSYITLFERLNSPEVRTTGTASAPSTGDPSDESVK